MHNHMFIATALFGRLFLCPRIAMHSPRPPPYAQRWIKSLTTKRRSLCTITPAPIAGQL